MLPRGLSNYHDNIHYHSAIVCICIISEDVNFVNFTDAVCLHNVSSRKDNKIRILTNNCWELIN